MKILRYTFLAAIIAILFALPQPAAANEATSFTVGLEWMSFHYEEPRFMREDGSLLGLYATYRIRRRQFVGEATVLYGYGTVRYDGALTDGTPWKADSEDHLVEGRVTAGYRNPLGRRGVLIPYAGLAGRALYDDLPPPYGYLRQQFYVYMPLGIRYEIAAGPRMILGVTGEYDYFVQGRNVSAGSEFRQDTGHGLRVSGSLTYTPANGRFSLVFEPFARYWDVDDSTISADGWYEPANNTATYGLRVGVLF